MITEDDALVYLSFDDWEKQSKQHRTDMLIKRVSISEYLLNTSVTPEDVLLEKERMEEISRLVILLKDNLSEKSFDILWLYAVEKWTQGEIAEKYSTYQRNISRILDKIQKTCLKLLSNGTITSELFREPQSKLEAHSPETAGYPHEILQNCNDGGEWKRCGRNGLRWITKSTCRLLDYLEESFGDDLTTCGICWDDFGENRCKRKEDYG